MDSLFGNKFIWTLLFSWIAICASQTTKVLLRVDAGTGVNFIDLWNLNGYSLGSSTSPIHRSGTIDNPYAVNCPEKYYLDIDSYTITYAGVLTTHINSWILEAPSVIEHSVNPQDVTIEIANSGVIFKLSDSLAPTNLYLAVDFTGEAAPYPKYYYVTSGSPKMGPIPGNESNFIAGSFLQIKGRYAAGCDIGDHSLPIIESYALELLQGVTTTETAMTTTEAETTTEEQTTVSTTTEEPTTMSTTTTEAETTTEEQTTVTVSTTTEAETMTTQTETMTITNRQTSLSGTTQAMCPCDCDFKQRLDTLSAVSDIPIEELKVQLAPVIQEIKENLTVDASKLSTTIRKKQSASDERESAEQVGVIGAVLLGFTFGLLILIDISSMPRHMMLAKQNCLNKH